MNVYQGEIELVVLNIFTLHLYYIVLMNRNEEADGSSRNCFMK